MLNRAGDEARPDATITRLIQQGRDREAAELGSAHLAPRVRGMGPIEQLDVILPMVSGIVGSLQESHLDRGTPCTNFNVRQVLEHMVGGATMFAAAFRGSTDPAAPPADPVAGFAAAMGDLQAAIAAPGALERTVPAPFGEVPGEVFARFVALDGLVHGWDIATATGQPYDPPLDVVLAVDAFAREAIEALRDGDTFADPVDAPAGASPLTQLIAFTGRRVD